jgi:hypothetical protein
MKVYGITICQDVAQLLNLRHIERWECKIPLAHLGEIRESPQDISGRVLREFLTSLHGFGMAQKIVWPPSIRVERHIGIYFAVVSTYFGR